MSEIADVQRYFREQAAQFDSIYEGKGPVLRWLDRKFRASIFVRYALTFEHAGDVTGKRVLDIGCGSGRYCVEFAQRGAAEVVGVDLSDNMIALARREAERLQVADRCHFLVDDFNHYRPDEPFDVVIAMGVFDYLREPEPWVERMVGVCRGRWMASFPKWDLLRAPLRRWRYRLRNCPVYYYTDERVVQIMRACHLAQYVIKDIPGRGQDWFVCAEVGRTPA
ncbi:MAG TPA: class I SAM-dependent methyltransferase [Phycisphaerae bacterium]|nr:class I SAM-dependent methyltransferase [Phycisphaerae bacterium]HNU46320.1 class I SAM-dependent methyltransferase [Phycisphaerae bacterium]